MELGDVAVFVKVIQSGSFTEAARRLGAPKSTISSKVLGLERRLGVTLLQRTTRKLHLTEEGASFFQTCVRALGDIESAEAVAASGQKVPQGTICVTAPNESNRVIAYFLKGFLARYPNIRVDLRLTNRYIDLVGEGIDVAIRAGDQKDSSLVAKKVANTRWGFFATPNYLAEKGTPDAPNDLEKHNCIVFLKLKNEPVYLSNGKQKAEIKLNSVVTADDLAALRELALQDLGVILVPTFFCREDVAAKRLVPLLPGWSSAHSPISIVYPAQKFQLPKIRVFVDELADLLRDVYGSADAVCTAKG